MEPSKGRGRGLALLEAMRRAQNQSASQEPGPTPVTSVSPSDIPPSASSVPAGGRGRAVMMLAKLQQQKPGSSVPSFTPASDVRPSTQIDAPTGGGRGKLLQKLRTDGISLYLTITRRLLQDSVEMRINTVPVILPPSTNVMASKASSVVSGQGDVSEVSQMMAESTITCATTSTQVAKNKYFKEVKETPPVVMKGQSGTPVEVTANFIYLKFEENSVFEYEVRYDPDQDYRNLRFRLLNEHEKYFKDKTFDGTTLYVPHQLPDEALDLISTNPFDQTKVKVSIIFRRTRRLSEMIHLYNVLFKSIMKDLELVRFGRQYFSEKSAIQIPQHKLEVWPGYVTAVDEYEGGLMLTLDSTHRVLRTQSVLSFINNVVQTQGTNWKRAVLETLVGCCVMTTYNKKLFRVDSIDDTMTPKSTFEKNEKGQVIQISFIDYYKNNYGIHIMDWDQPMLVSRETKRMPGSEKPIDIMICLVPELCQLTGLSDEQRNNFRLMKDVATYTRITPNQRHRAFKEYIKNVMSNEKAKSRLKGWGLSLAPETIDITARTLPPEPIMFGNNNKVPGRPNADWKSMVTKNPVMAAVDIMHWVVIHTERDRQCTNDFIETVQRNCRPMGISVRKPTAIALPNDRTESYVRALKKVTQSSEPLQLVVCVCPTARDDRYAAIKRICCSEHPVPSQVINARTIMRPDKIRAITQMIMLQMNCKLGGTLWEISIPFKTAMVVGIDVYHEAAHKSNSVCAIVASFNKSMTLWFSRVIVQEKGQEIADGLKTCISDAAKHYCDVNQRFPDKIIVYRDGVGDGQLKLIQDYEIPQMKLALTSINGTYEPQITYVVVQKRINTRIFMKSGGEFDNPPPGTVVDHDITRRDWYDFLIVSQHVTQGTVTPTHYIVAHDESGMTPDQCQRLTYKLCHLYYNWPGTVRVPAPCQYAHKLAYLVGQSVKHTPSPQLCDKLFFL